MKKTKLKLFNFRMEEKLINAFREEATNRGLTASAFLRNMIIRELANPTPDFYEYEDDTKDL